MYQSSSGREGLPWSLRLLAFQFPPFSCWPCFAIPSFVFSFLLVLSTSLGLGCCALLSFLPLLPLTDFTHYENATNDKIRISCPDLRPCYLSPRGYACVSFRPQAEHIVICFIPHFPHQASTSASDFISIAYQNKVHHHPFGLRTKK